ncbi:hypothetical protein LEP1GSC034_4008 [Leptospira interrogans str. 2003000735]|uniref:Uncharacterized protein n=2 Tax=Leptospira interrogans TaxID=173 RepID=A0A829D3F3_LEPIR|nr:hypothetical protein [Leptospira interrogans]EMY06234.1 hypothetical protein LEP1GSC029_1727 [Leptospira interrogans str. 2002000626]EMY25338.1 hypothetical protein LEP1GSC115_1659 [Leptospira interrogans serovar Australis str. 200703203]EKN90067.1 hypothetical protein LEP1GSC027_1291 [Leptospira interrogans str. 2002000624]EKQ39166.1 hypothetical protein LEP1GSC025_4132 [Leptospira interrogans str. 2002000621]EKQ49367.1 hypothetical protein LEP1GSC026_2374 [Leptospira interrogans str. 2002
MSGESGKSGEDFPFYPFRDFLLGEVIFKTLQEDGVSPQDAEDAVLSHLTSDKKCFVFTPNAKKQTLLNLYPEKIRGLLKTDQEEKIRQEFCNMIQTEGKMDLALELLEWLFTGFEERRKLLNELFSLFLNDKIPLRDNFLDRLKINYEEEVLKDLKNLE